ncbi:queuosine-tRNA galactosyltransferase-like [Oratosquilla oratoria]|uniref:queuosine-tRNA galactosyltransferase-like n=1 Tax=Oratosquilla oratoria TaxID=337810 RepID=UPI003F76A6CB
MENNIDVTVVIPVHNASTWLDECLEAIAHQKSTLSIEVSLFLDSCEDNSADIAEIWREKLQDIGYSVIITSENNGRPKGVGYAKNKAVAQSKGEFLCFQDADDIMQPKRIQMQYEHAFLHKNAIVGCQFKREPPDSTVRFTKWANTLTQEQLTLQVYTSHGPTVIMPTWFCHRSVFDKCDGFDETGKGTPEDLIFFYKHLQHGGEVFRVDQELLTYRYHQAAATFSVEERTIWDLRVKELQERVLSQWPSFTIWNAGKQGRKFYRSLHLENQKKVMAFCDVDTKKVGTVYTYEEAPWKPKPKVPIIHFKEAHPPIIICMKMDLTRGDFEENLASLNLKEGTDFYHFN